MLDSYLPTKVNEGPWVTAYTLHYLRDRPDAKFVLPICSITTPYSECAQLGEWVLPPLFHEAMDETLKRELVSRILHCFPIYGQDNSGRLQVVEIPRGADPPTDDPGDERILAFSVDTAVEEHGPHLPLATDTIQSYSVLRELGKRIEQMEICRPLEYGQMTWGLPFGHSIDITAELLTRYVTGYANALVRWKNPRAIYVVDVHGSISHRGAIVDGMKHSDAKTWSFRWLHEPLAEFASERADQHAGGVETALVERVSVDLLDSRWWPDRIAEIEQGQMEFARAVELTPDLPAFIRYVQEAAPNGIVGRIRNYDSLDADQMFQRMLDLATDDCEKLLGGESSTTAGSDLW